MEVSGAIWRDSHIDRVSLEHFLLDLQVRNNKAMSNIVGDQPKFDGLSSL